MNEKLKNRVKEKAQREYCSENNVPYFAMRTCPSCGSNVYKKLSLEEAKTELITSCSICNYSFVG